jgi:LTXXQ motif family protein
LRALPPQQRAARRQDIQNARQQRAQQRQAQPNALTAQPSLAAQQSTRVRSGLRRNGSPRLTVQAARQGRFAAAFTARAQGRNANARFARAPAHQAWRRGQRAGFVPWYGPVFWPYAYSDIFDYTFWPGGYDDGYWAVAYDDFFDGVFFGEAGPPSEYVDVAPSATAEQPAPRASYAAVQELCKQPGSGVTAWPVADIDRKVGLNDEQKQLLNAVKIAGEQAAGAFKATCPAENAFPLTPSGRLGAMTARLDAMLEAVRTVRPPLENFYASLSDEQKERFNAIGPKPSADNAAAGQVPAIDAKSCKEQKPGLTNLPIEQIEDAVKPTDAQDAGLKGLEEATAKAVSIMQTACPEDTPVTPPGRLQAMETRLQAMIDAANTVKPALDSFYGSLSNEQKARFNRIGRDLAQSGG